MAPNFGTSGLRGLVSELTDELCAGYARAFLRVTPQSGTLFIGRDLRPSSVRIARAVAAAGVAEGLKVRDCGAVPTPALALAAMAAGAPSIMVTGSHIPADRNGLKFYTPTGEIDKVDEAAIKAAFAPGTCPPARADAFDMALPDYVHRYTGFLPDTALSGLTVGLYEHSSVARDLLADTLAKLGARVVRLGRSDGFIPVDTEAVSEDTRAMLRGWAARHRLDAIVSTDGDADRPLVADAGGEVVPGDVIGALTAMALGATLVVTPVSSNTLIEMSKAFGKTVRTKIGSPYVIAAMGEAIRNRARVVGFEANGGFLLGFSASGPVGSLEPLMTRDAMLPILMPLATAVRQGKTLTELVAALPARVTMSDRAAEVPTEKSRALVDWLTINPAERDAFFAHMGSEAALDLTDGMRVTFASGEIVHLRPSGNAPELRCYAEATNVGRATELVRDTLAKAVRSIARL